MFLPRQFVLSYLVFVLSGCAASYPIVDREFRREYSPRITLDTEVGDTKKSGWTVGEVAHNGENFLYIEFRGTAYVYTTDGWGKEHDFSTPLNSPTYEYYRHCYYNVERLIDTGNGGFHRVTALTGYRREFNLLLNTVPLTQDSRLEVAVVYRWLATNAPSELRASFCNIPGHQDQPYAHLQEKGPRPPVFTPAKPWPVEMPDAKPGPPDLPTDGVYGELYDSGCSVTPVEMKSSPVFGSRNCRKTVFLPDGLCHITNTNSGSFFTNLTCGNYAFCNHGLTYPGPDFGKYRESNTVKRIDEGGIKGYLASFECRNVPTGKWLIEVN